MKQLFSLLLLWSVVIVGVQAQNVDSLLNVLETKKLMTTEQLDIYKKICLAYRYVDLDKTKLYCKKGLDIAGKENDYTMSMNFYTYLAGAYKAKDYLDSASVYYKKAVDFALDTKDEYIISNAYNRLGAIYLDMNELTLALEYLLKALTAAEKIDNKEMSAMTMCNIGTVYRGLDQIDMSLKYMVKADSLADIIDHYAIQVLANKEICLLLINKDENEEALIYGQKALDICRKNDLKDYESNILSTIATIYRLLEKYDIAEEYMNQSLQMMQEQEGNPGYFLYIRDIWIELAAIYLEQKRYKESELTATKAWEMDSIGVGANFTAKTLITSNIYLGNKEKAIYYLNKYADLSAARFEEHLHRSAVEMQTKYETEKKELQIASLEKEKQLYTWIGIVGFLLTTSLGIILFLNIRNTKKEKQLIATRSVMDGEMKERTRLARDLHDRLSGNLSSVKIELSNAESLLDVGDKLDNCIEEVRRVAHNLMPASLQYGLKTALEDFAAQFPTVYFHFFGTESRIEERSEFVIYCCANELVSNSLRHSGAKKINMQLVQEDRHVTLTVQDDGNGYDEKAVKKGLGLKNIYDRVTACNGKIDVVSSSERGTETIIELKIN